MPDSDPLLFDSDTPSSDLGLLSQGEAAPASTNAPGPDAPLAARMRPRTLDEFVGQESVVGPGTLLRRAIERDNLTLSSILGSARQRQIDPGAHNRKHHARLL